MDTVVSPTELKRRTIRHADWVPCKAAFIDCRTPGSDTKDNYSFIGPGVTQNSEQYVNLKEPHGFNLGAAGMPHGTVNSLHLHFTAEVFINFDGDYLLRWGAQGDQGEYLSSHGDVISVPTWIFRGFTNVGSDDGVLLTVLGRDDTGGIIWGPSVIEEAARHGLYLTADNLLVDTVSGDAVPEGQRLIKPMPGEEIDRLDAFTVEQFRSRVTTDADRTWVQRPFLCSELPGGGAQLCAVIGYGMVEDRRATPRLSEPHAFNLAWLRAVPGDGVLLHRHDHCQILTVRAGRWTVRLNQGEGERTVELGPRDTLSVPPGAWRSYTCTGAGEGRPADEGTGELLVVNAGDGRVELEWSEEVVRHAAKQGWVLDANRYLAPAAVLATATEDD